MTVDSVLFTLHEQALRVLLVKRASHPQQGRWGLHGGFIDMEKDESTRATALRKLTEKRASPFTAGATGYVFRGKTRSPWLESDHRPVCVNLPGSLRAAYRERQRCQMDARNRAG